MTLPVLSNHSFTPAAPCCAEVDPALLAALTWLVGREVATRVLSLAGTPGVTSMKAPELASVAGISPAAAERIVATRYLGTLFVQEARRPLAGPAAVLGALPLDLFSSEVELLYGLALDGRHGLKGSVLLGKGGATGVGLQVRDVFTPLLRLGAVSIILAHNHPSGDPRPSNEDISMTAQVAEGAELLGLTLLDHLIVAQGRVTSLFELGHIPSGQELASRFSKPRRAPSR